jgi:transcriptional regulator with XRE-family HTH domain
MERANLTEARLRKCWSQEEAAAAFGIDHLTLYRWEAGKSTPRGYNLRKLCEVYGMTAAELGFDGKRKGREETTSLIQTVQTDLPNRTTIQLLSAYAENQKEILRQLSEIMTYDMQEAIHELESVILMNAPDPIARRQAIARLLGIPLLVSAGDSLFLNRLTEAALFSEKDSLALYEDILVMGWDGFRRSKSPEVIGRIDGYVNKLARLSRTIPEKKREQWQSLLCRFSQLSTRIAQHSMNEQRALSMAKQAIEIAIELDDAELIASAFYQRHIVHLEYSKTATDAGQKQRHLAFARVDVDAALAHAENVRTPLKGNIYLTAAETYAFLASNDGFLRTQCETWQDKVATLVYTSTIEEDGTFLKLDTTALHHEKSKTLLQFGRLQEARRELDTAWKTLPPNLLTWQMNMYLTEASLSITERDVEKSSKSGTQAYTIAKAIHSRKGKAEVKHLVTELQSLDSTNSYARDLDMIIKGES